MTSKLVYICDEYPPFRNGGIGTYTKEVAEQLVERDHDVTVVGVYKDITCDTETVQNGVKVIQLSPTRFGMFGDRYKLYRHVKKFARVQKIDFLECQEVGGYLAFWPRTDFKIIVRLHGSITHTDHVLGRTNWKNKIWKALEKSTLKRADHIVSVSAYTAKCTQKIFGLSQLIEVVYNGIALPNCPHPVHKDDGPFHVVYAGSLLKQKGVMSLMTAWQIVQRTLPDAHLHLAGKDSQNLWHDARDILGADLPSVSYHGILKKSDLERLYSTSHLAVFPSYVEAFSLAPMEAMAVGLPVIYTQRASGGELITEGVTGKLIDPDDIAGIARAIIDVAQMSAAKRAALGLRGQKHVQDHFTIEKLIDNTEALLRQLA